ncbi:MAG TPA: hypothetical protein VGG39_36690 [Polyangiaceae bacterium]|jgi:hypothetical protein
MSSTTPNATRAQTLAALQALVTGLQKQFPNGTFTLESTQFSTQDLVTLIQGVIDALNALIAAESASKVALTNAQGKVAKASPTISALRRNLFSMFGNAPPTLAIFGLQPPKAKVPRTTQQKAAAAAKAKATRAARGTVSRKAKAAIKGNVVGVQITPATVTVTPDPAPSAQQAPAPPPVPITGTSK